MQKHMVIMANYAIAGESYGLLGPQMAATVISCHTDYDCIVVGVGHEFDKVSLKKELYSIAGSERPVIGFSHLGGRQDLLELAKELKGEGAVTILGGPQADVDFRGEEGWEQDGHRFRGLRDNFSYTIHGPAESIIPLLKSIDEATLDAVPGLLRVEAGKCLFNPGLDWQGAAYGKVNWQNLYLFSNSNLKPVSITLAQVVQQIGCPYAARARMVELDYPSDLNDAPFRGKGKISLELRGCSFCDVARDKGYAGKISMETMLAQVAGLPEGVDGRKVAFELINEQAVSTLPAFLKAVEEQRIEISQVNLVTRSDWFHESDENMRRSLTLAKSMHFRILLSQVGFESFSDSILKNLNKGYTFDVNLRAIRLARRLKAEFPDNWFYATPEGAYHGFIHPTPWDSDETRFEMNTNITIYGINQDILPPHNTPLLIHHACGLGDWVRELEKRENIQLKRVGSLIMW